MSKTVEIDFKLNLYKRSYKIENVDNKIKHYLKKVVKKISKKEKISEKEAMFAILTHISMNVNRIDYVNIYNLNSSDPKYVLCYVKFYNMDSVKFIIENKE